MIVERTAVLGSSGYGRSYIAALRCQCPVATYERVPGTGFILPPSSAVGLLGGEFCHDAMEGMVNIRARVQNSQGEHQATASTNGSSQAIDIPPKASGFGSSANGGELLFLALATCYCNDLYREAAKRGITVGG
jgi:hypothetical protein